MNFKVIQLTKINTLDFEFTDKDNLTFPIPPLTSANLFYDADQIETLKICSTLYINSRDSKTPVVGTLTEEGATFEIYFDYDWDDATPETYDVWYAEIDYTSNTVGNISEVTSYLKNLNSQRHIDLGEDPKTSRGTKTSVND